MCLDVATVTVPLLHVYVSTSIRLTSNHVLLHYRLLLILSASLSLNSTSTLAGTVFRLAVHFLFCLVLSNILFLGLTSSELVCQYSVTRTVLPHLQSLANISI